MDDVRIYDKALNEQQLLDLLVNGVSPTWNKAEKPEPADGTLNVGAPLFRWAKGETAMFHDVYLGTSPELTEADRVATRLAQPMTFYYHIPGLTPGATYYWRVDEIEKDGVTTHAGDVWTFVAQAADGLLPQPRRRGQHRLAHPDAHLAGRRRGRPAPSVLRRQPRRGHPGSRRHGQRRIRPGGSDLQAGRPESPDDLLLACG